MPDTIAIAQAREVAAGFFRTHPDEVVTASVGWTVCPQYGEPDDRGARAFHETDLRVEIAAMTDDIAEWQIVGLQQHTGGSLDGDHYSRLRKRSPDAFEAAVYERFCAALHADHAFTVAATTALSDEMSKRGSVAGMRSAAE